MFEQLGRTQSRWRQILRDGGRRLSATTRAGRKRSKAADCDEDEFVEAINVSKRSLLASRVRWAGTSEARRRGLLGRAHLESDEGVYIVPTQLIHMFGMRFPIDVAFLDSGGRVLFIHHGIKPNRLSRLVWRAEGALELTAGTLRATETTVGDVIEFRRIHNDR